MDSASVAGIAIGASVGTLILSALISYAKSPRAYQAGPRLFAFGEYFTFINWFKVLYYFLPYGLFLFGIIYDGMIRKIRFFPAGFIGLGNVYLNSLLSYFISKTPLVDADICGIPGMSQWGSAIAPQNILFSTTVFSYIAAYITTVQSDSTYSGITWGGVFIIFLIQLAMYYSNKCYDSRPSGSWLFAILGSITPPLYALMGGLLVGGLSGYLIASNVGSVGGGIDVTQQQSLVGGKGPAMAPTSGTAGAGTCSPTNNDDQFVCEAYKNGELVTSTIVE